LELWQPWRGAPTAATLARAAAAAPNPVPESPQPDPPLELAHPTLPGLFFSGDAPLPRQQGPRAPRRACVVTAGEHEPWEHR
jgi:hypothetical protein